MNEPKEQSITDTALPSNAELPNPVLVTSTTEPDASSAASLQEPASTMLEVHAPHAAPRNWKDFFAQIATIVIGLLLAVGIEQTVEYFHHQSQAAVFEESLRADLREEHWSWQLLLDYNHQVLRNAERAINALEGKSELTNESLLVSAYRATQYRNRLQRRDTFDELVSTGAIGMLRDPLLRRTAIKFYNLPIFDNIVNEGLASRFREEFRSSIANDVQRALAKQCGDRAIVPNDYSTIPGALDYACSTGLSESSIDNAVRALKSNPNLLGALRLRVANLETRLNDLVIRPDVRNNLEVVIKQTP